MGKHPAARPALSGWTRSESSPDKPPGFSNRIGNQLLVPSPRASSCGLHATLPQANSGFGQSKLPACLPRAERWGLESLVFEQIAIAGNDRYGGGGRGERYEVVIGGIS